MVSSSYNELDQSEPESSLQNKGKYAKLSIQPVVKLHQEIE